MNKFEVEALDFDPTTIPLWRRRWAGMFFECGWQGCGYDAEAVYRISARGYSWTIGACPRHRDAIGGSHFNTLQSSMASTKVSA